ncbi:Origin of replication complex subunit 4 [Hibiscus syriacus]|uniref:Origin of replication complex subunit 4 n=1 Tax=Hibiscus syriacus TaxID=106335 RepID=A0A6A2Z0V8_HIBSY|nr:origin of replication complex subunit 4-like [Hibiscus syriacus]KAE8684765.1 Origin of replication complex subunit 4 [Hibiscus syriacus]
MGREKEKEKPSEKALNLLRSRLTDPNFIFRPLSDYPDSNYSKLKFIISTSVTEACNNSILLLGPRGSGKVAVLELVLSDLLQQYPEGISVIRLNGLLHSDDNCALKEIARQLCVEHQLLFSKVASFDDNSQFIIAMLRECGLAHKTIIFVLDEFDFFAQGKQRLLYSLLDAMQSVNSQAVVIGVSCRLDVDQLLEKRVRSRFSHRKLLFLSPSKEDTERFMEHILSLPVDSNIPHNYAAEFNGRLKKIFSDDRFKELINTYLSFNFTIGHLVRFLFQAVSYMDLDVGFLSLENFKTALSSNQRQPKLECIRDCSILELYMLVCMKRLEVKEQNSYNFYTVMTEYKTIHDSSQTSDNYAANVCLRAFEHLLQRQLINFIDNRGHNQSVEFRPVKLLISSAELHQGLKSYHQCPAILLKKMDR